MDNSGTRKKELETVDRARSERKVKKGNKI